MIAASTVMNGVAQNGRHLPPIGSIEQKQMRNKKHGETYHVSAARSTALRRQMAVTP